MNARQRSLDRQLADLAALATEPGAETRRARLRQALRDRHPLLVARAARLAADLGERTLADDLVGAFDRLLAQPGRADPRCLAKEALVQALRTLGHRDPNVYRRGFRYVQLEPAYGGRADTAGELRGVCALGLAESTLDELSTLGFLADGLADPLKEVRINCALALRQLDRPAGALVLRLKVRLGDPEVDVLGHCCAALLTLAPDDGVELVAEVLTQGGVDAQLEAACALAQCGTPRAVEVLAEFWALCGWELAERRALLACLGAGTRTEAAELLLQIVREERAELALAALEALAGSRFRSAFRGRVREVVAARGLPELEAGAAARFGEEG